MPGFALWLSRARLHPVLTAHESKEACAPVSRAAGDHGHFHSEFQLYTSQFSEKHYREMQENYIETNAEDFFLTKYSEASLNTSL